MIANLITGLFAGLAVAGVACIHGLFVRGAQPGYEDRWAGALCVAIGGTATAAAIAWGATAA